MINKLIKDYGLYFAWLIALLATLSSLYMSNFIGFPVCHLCWFQRVCLYPFVIILGIAAYRHDKNIIIYSLPLLIIGGLFSIYQYLEQMIPGFGPINVCGNGPSCSDIHLLLLGFITLPLLSFIIFVVIILLLIGFYTTNKQP